MGRGLVLRNAAVYSAQTHPWEGMEVGWERNAHLSISKTSLWQNASNWPRICGIALSRTVRRLHSHPPKRLSLMHGWRSCDVAQTPVSRGRSSATGSTIVCGGEIDDSRSRSACGRGGHRRGGTLVRESCIGFGQRVFKVGGGRHRRHPTDARGVPQSTGRRPPSSTPALPARALLPDRWLGRACDRMYARTARPGSLAASDWSRQGRRLDRLGEDHLERPSGPAGDSHGGA